MAHYYPRIILGEIDEQQMSGYLQHIPTLVKMQSEGISSLLTQMLGSK